MRVDEKPIYRTKKPVYEMELSIYPVAVCGEDLQTGNPVKVSEKGEDLYTLKLRTEELVLSVVPCNGKCFMEVLITKNNEYYDCDEGWINVNLSKKKVEVLI